jgi:pimeloyl-ACP methyl ester carboxylesterase
VATISDDARPPRLGLLLREAPALLGRFWRAFGRLGERGPQDGRKLLVVPGFLATDHTTLGLQRALAAAGYRVTGWGMGLNRGVAADTLVRLAARLEAFGGGAPVILVGWSLGGVMARETAKARPDLVSKVVTLGSPFSGDPRANNAWRIYERVAGHPVDDPPIHVDLAVKPPQPTLAIWSRKDGIVAPASARGLPGESDRQVELDCSHMGFGVSGRAYPRIIAALRAFGV